jgi:succinoglycan biosynthesis transport protein ExoP
VQGAPRYASLRDYLRVLRQQRWLILAITLACALAALGLAVREQPVYVAEASLGARDIVQEYQLIGEDAAGATPPQQLAALTADLATRPAVADRVRRRLRLRLTVEQLQARVTARVETRTNLVVLAARASNRELAASLANAFAEEARLVARDRERKRLAAAVDELQDEVAAARKALKRQEPVSDVRLGVALQRLSQLRSVENLIEPVELVQRAAAPRDPTSPRPVRDTVLGALLGLVLGLVLAFARDSLDRRLRSSGDVQAELDLPVLSRASEDALGKAGLAQPDGSVEDADLESFRVLRTALQFLSPEAPPKVVLVTSGLPEEGKSTVAASLAAAAASAGRRVLLIECDLRRPSLAKRLGVEGSPGLGDYLAGRATPAEVLRTIKLPGRGDDSEATLVYLPAGDPSTRPAELLGNERSIALLRDVREVYDLVVCDTSPLLSVVDALELVPHADAVVLCMRAGRTTRDQARAVKEALARVPSRPTGIVVTGVKARDEEAYGYYSYAYGAEPAT